MQIIIQGLSEINLHFLNGTISIAYINKTFSISSIVNKNSYVTTGAATGFARSSQPLLRAPVRS